MPRYDSGYDSEEVEDELERTLPKEEAGEGDLSTEIDYGDAVDGSVGPRPVVVHPAALTFSPGPASPPSRGAGAGQGSVAIGAGAGNAGSVHLHVPVSVANASLPESPAPALASEPTASFSPMPNNASSGMQQRAQQFNAQAAYSTVAAGTRSQQTTAPAEPDLASIVSSQRQLAAAIAESIEFTRAAERIQELQQHVEVLTKRLLAASSDRDKAEAALIEQAKQHEAAQQRLRDMYEARLKEQAADFEAQFAAKVRELGVLKAKVERLEEQGPKGKLLGRTSTSTAGGAGSSGAGAKDAAAGLLTADEAAALRREVAETESLLKGYQQENEAAMRKIKELEAALKEAGAARFSAALHADGAAMRETGHGLGGPGGTRASSKEAATRLSEILTLQQQLDGLREQSAAREAELKSQVDKLRTEKKELEARKGGVDLKQMQEGDALVKQVRGEMESMRAQYQGMVSELQAKLSWYIENQELLTKNDALVAEQQQVISQLEQRLAFYETPEGKSAVKRVKELTSQVAALQAALKARVPPNSMAAIIEASKPPVEERAAVAALENKVAALTRKLDEKDDEYERQLRAYQQQYEQLWAQFQEKTSKLEAAARARKKEKELQAQLDETRTTFTKRVRELEAKLKQQQGAGARTSGSGTLGGEDAVPVALLRQKETEVRKLQQELERKTKQVAEMHLKLGEAEARIVRMGEAMRRSVPSTPTPMSPAHTPGSKQQQGQVDGRDVNPFGWGQADQQGRYSIASSSAEAGGVQGAGAVWQLQQRVAALSTECESLRQQLASARQEIAILVAAKSRPEPSALEAEVETLKRRVEAADLAMASVQKAHTQAVERCATLQAEHQRAQVTLHDEVAYKEGLKWQERLAAADAELRAAKARITTLEGDLAVAQERLRSGWSPAAAEFAALEAKLEAVAKEQASREAKWRTVLEDTRSLYAAQSEMAQRKWEVALAAKNTELEGLKVQVEGLITAAQTAMVAKAQQHRA